MKRSPRIFISYAREDYDSVLLIYRSLEVRGYHPWMDKQNLAGGEDWVRAIVRAVRECDFFLFCASPNSVNKRGPIQREIKEALNMWKEKLEDDIYFIPVRLERCEMPDSIQKFHWIDWLAGDGMREIERSITIGLSRIEGIDLIGPLRLENRRLKQSKPGTYDLDVDYPELLPAIAPGIAEINAAISAFARRSAFRFQKHAEAFGAESIGSPSLPSSSLEISYTPELVSEDLVVFRFTELIYMSGAMHPNSHTKTFNFRRRPFVELDLIDILNNDNNPIENISKFCISDLLRQLGIVAGKIVESDEWISQGAAPAYDNFTQFLLRPDGILFVFDAYHVACYAGGRKEVLLSFSDIAPLLEPEIKTMLENSVTSSATQRVPDATS